jgi:hypothetical protein
VGYFEGIDSERGIAWRVANSLALRRFLLIGLDERTPDHSTISRTRRLIEIDTHREVLAWVLGRLAERGLLKGQRMGIDATTLEANAAMRSIVRRDSGETYEEFLRGLAKASGIETPTREDLAQLDRKRKKRTSNKEWKSPADEDARIAKMKDGRTHLAHKAEHAVDLDTGAIVAVTLQAADQGDTKTLDETLCEAGEQIAEQIRREAELRPQDKPKVHLQGIEELVTDKGYHSGAVLQRVKSYEVRSYIPEKKQKGRRDDDDLLGYRCNEILGWGHLSVGKRRMTSPAFEGPVKSTGFRESQQKCNFSDSKSTFSQVAGSDFAPHLREDLSKARPFFLKAAVQRSRTHVQPGSDLLKTWFSVTKFSRQQATD